MTDQIQLPEPDLMIDSDLDSDAPYQAYSVKYAHRLIAEAVATPRKQLTDDQIMARKPVCADFVSFRAGIRSIELDLGIYK